MTLNEIGESFSLSNILSYGTLPINITEKDDDAKKENLRSYVDVYLKEEIEAEFRAIKRIAPNARCICVCPKEN